MSALGLPAHVSLMFAVPLILIIGMIAAIIVRHAVTAAKNSASPVVTEKVTVVAKRQIISGGPNTGHHTAYFVTFESGGGERKGTSRQRRRIRIDSRGRQRIPYFSGNEIHIVRKDQITGNI